MRIERFDPARDTESLRDCYRVYAAAAPIDEPNWPAASCQMFAGWLRFGWTEDPVQTWLARDDDGEILGWYQLILPSRENQHLAHLSMTVDPARRRAGLGTLLVAHAAARAREAGRTAMASDCVAGTPGEAFARAVGAKQTMTEIGRVLRLASIPAGRLAELRAGAEKAAAGYSLLRWRGPAPREHVDAIATVFAAVADMPHAEGHQAQQWDGDRVRLEEARTAAQGVRRYTVAAQETATGELAALTQMSVDPGQPSWGYQQLTVAARPHRGHRLGLLVKLEMLAWLATAEPRVTSVLTGNASGNEHMIAINAQLGYEVLGEELSFEMPVERAASLPSRRARGAPSQP
jgi:GNAT superfamily N-acetyltransferase/RimJ/RimL family protein N-acetyltransferase